MAHWTDLRYGGEPRCLQGHGEGSLPPADGEELLAALAKEGQINLLSFPVIDGDDDTLTGMVRKLENSSVKSRSCGACLSRLEDEANERTVRR